MIDSYDQTWAVRAPDGAAEVARMLDLRWEVLRAPWGQPRGSEADAADATAVQRTAVTAGGRVVGIGRLHETAPGEGQVRYMAVAEGWRGRGIGGSILEALEAEARRLGMRRIVLNSRVEAAGLYRRHGYRTVGPGPLLFGAIAHLAMEKRWDSGPG